MEGQCKFCNGTQWVDVRVDPIPPWSDFMSVDQDINQCPLCNLEGSSSDYFELSNEIQEQIPYWVATAIGGFEGQWGLFENFVDGVLVQSLYVHRAVCNYSSWVAELPIEDCPVCLGWGVWSNNGQILDCIACGGQPIEMRTGYQPLHAWWLRKLGPGAIYMQRGRPETTALSGDELIAHIEMHPNIIRIN